MDRPEYEAKIRASQLKLDEAVRAANDAFDQTEHHPVSGRPQLARDAFGEAVAEAGRVHEAEVAAIDAEWAAALEAAEAEPAT